MASPEQCNSREAVREEIDRIDGALIALLAERWSYVDRMWQLKRAADAEASVPWRNREVIDRVRQQANEAGMPPELAESLWRTIIGWGIQYQEEKLRDDE